MLKSYELRIPQVILSGPDCVNNLGAEITRLNKKKALLITDEMMQKFGVADKIIEILKGSGIDTAVYAGVGGEPTDKNVAEGLKVYQDEGCDFLVGLGGGSPADTAKAVGIMTTNPGKISDYMGAGKVPNPIPPLVIIATTAGTGSEITKFTIIADTEKDVKMLIGIDALCHAIEAYVSKKSQPISDFIALEAIRLISANLRTAWANGTDVEARSNMMLGATLAGIAFSNASVTLIHGMSRPIGALFHIPHGVSNAALLPVWAEYSYIGNVEKFAKVAEAMGENIVGLSTLDAAYMTYEAVKQLCEDIQIPTISGLGIDKAEYEKHIPKMATDAIASGSPGNNPRFATPEDIMELYKKAW
jgi:alcohol dehydrogenase class IV